MGRLRLHRSDARLARCPGEASFAHVKQALFMATGTAIGGDAAYPR